MKKLKASLANVVKRCLSKAKQQLDTGLAFTRKALGSFPAPHKNQVCVVVYAYNLSSWEVEAGELGVPGQSCCVVCLCYGVCETLFQQNKNTSMLSMLEALDSVPNTTA